MKDLDPGLAIEVRLDNSHVLIEAFEAETLDAVIVRSDDNRLDGEVLGPEHYA